MGCRVGMTTDTDARERYWRRQYPGLYAWKVEARHLTKKDAQAKENSMARHLNCDSSGGGDDPDDTSKTWAVYYFAY